PEQVRRVVMSHIGAVRACYESEAQRNPGLKGGVTVQWHIDPGGSVTSASVAGTTLSNARVEGCIVRQVQKWKFPSSDSATTVAGFPFKFGVGG
ncbi:MAG TPA: AgmX/PglI C-terminal domain-containing protein, partial [Labilithrix sp.]|nr:AgmX/PglI C-terminal domain-containing protein [Labilithrix sp.]